MKPTTAPNSTVGGLNATMKPDNMTMANNKTIQPDSNLPVANISAGNMSTTWRLLYQNAGNWSDDSQAGYLLASRQVSYANASALCSTLHEKLAPMKSALDPGLQKQLAYLVYDGTYKSEQEFWIANGTAIIVPSQAKARLVTRPPHPSEMLPVLCTQTAPRNTINETSVDTKWRVTTDVYTGYRDARSFRFNAVPYAAPFKRFEQSSVITSRANVTAILQDQSRRCPQHVSPPDHYSDDCLVMNIYTPAVGKMKTKRPVMMWLHGGGFSAGTGLDFTFDGGEISSRGDVVIVTPNFRLGSIGFLSINDEAPGNYGFNDVLTALAWCKKYIAYFGGDPDNVTLFGQSSGAQMVQRVLGSPKATGLLSSAIIQSGRPQDQANALQTSAVAQKNASAAVIKELGCDTAADKLACLRALSTDKIINATQFSKMVVDGIYITSPLLDVAGKNGSYVMKLPMMMGFMRDETGSLGYVPPLNASLSEALANATLTPAQQEAVKNNLGSFPQMDVRNITVTAATDATSIKRCGQESTMLAAAMSGQFTSVYGYVQDQRAMQIPDYDPNKVCISDDPDVPYYFCHSGDLIPTFGTARFAFNLPPRDRGDIIWTSLMWDQWSSFARSKKPTPPNEYLEVRGYTSTAEAIHQRDGKWEEVRPSASTAKIMSLGPRQRMVTLLQNGAQCEALGLTIDYVSEGR